MPAHHPLQVIIDSGSAEESDLEVLRNHTPEAAELRTKVTALQVVLEHGEDYCPQIRVLGAVLGLVKSA